MEYQKKKKKKKKIFFQYIKKNHLKLKQKIGSK